jgi:UDP-GlcNAc3NAcA epimerase
MVCRAVRSATDRAVEHRIIHTGQHYDAALSDVFFEQLAIPLPDYHLGVGSGLHGAQTGEMLRKIEAVLLEDPPDWVVVYGDTNSTLAGALAAAKLHVPIAHVEAGLRSFNRRMPEEINRIATDHISDLLLCPTATALHHLDREGLRQRAVQTGDVMYDAVLAFREAAQRSGATAAGARQPATFALATIHRAENTDDPDRLRAIFSGLERIARDICPVLLPLHPRTARTLETCGFHPTAVTILPPAAYLDMLQLEWGARFILTDSGGVQKEAYFAQKPCITMRDETEWEETLANGCNVLTGADERRIFEAAVHASEAGPWTAVYGDGQAGAAILRALAERRPGRA